MENKIDYKINKLCEEYKNYKLDIFEEDFLSIKQFSNKSNKSIRYIRESVLDINQIHLNDTDLKFLLLTINKIISSNMPISIDKLFIRIKNKFNLSKNNFLNILKVFLLINENKYIVKKINNIHFISKKRYIVEKKISKVRHDKLSKMGVSITGRIINTKKIKKESIDKLVMEGYLSTINYLDLIIKEIDLEIKKKYFISKKSSNNIKKRIEKKGIKIKKYNITEVINSIENNEKYIIENNFITMRNVFEKFILNEILKIKFFMKDKDIEECYQIFCLYNSKNIILPSANIISNICKKINIDFNNIDYKNICFSDFEKNIIQNIEKGKSIEEINTIFNNEYSNSYLKLKLKEIPYIKNEENNYYI